MEQACPQGDPGSPWPGCSFPARHAQAEGNGPGEAVWEGVMSQKASSVDVGEPRFPLLGLSFPTRNNSWFDNLSVGSGHAFQSCSLRALEQPPGSH